MTQVLICSEALFMCPTSDYSAGGFVEVIQKEHLFQVYSLNHGRIFDPISREKSRIYPRKQHDSPKYSSFGIFCFTNSIFSIQHQQKRQGYKNLVLLLKRLVVWNWSCKYSLFSHGSYFPEYCLLCFCPFRTFHRTPVTQINCFGVIMEIRIFSSFINIAPV